MTKAEQEYIIRGDAESPVVTWYSCFSKHWRACERAGWRLVSEQKDCRGRVISREYEADRDLLSARPVSRASKDRNRERGVRVAAAHLPRPNGVRGPV